MLAGSADLIAAAGERARLGAACARPASRAAGIVPDRDGRPAGRRPRRARRLADALPSASRSVDPERVLTNIVCAARRPCRPRSSTTSRRRVRAGTIDPATVRLVTHKDVTTPTSTGPWPRIGKAGRV